MKKLIVLIGMILIALVIPIVSAEKAITEDSFHYNASSKSDIKEKPLITINITPYLSSGKQLGRKIDEKELPIDQMVTNLVEHINNGVKKTKYIQIYPETVLEMSDDAETIKQTMDGRVRLELYYGYQTAKPWAQYYKVENCDATKCRVVRADFATRQVWIETITVEIANGITGLPEYNDLPKGVKI